VHFCFGTDETKKRIRLQRSVPFELDNLLKAHSLGNSLYSNCLQCSSEGFLLNGRLVKGDFYCDEGIFFALRMDL
jgi:hypothetical protein